LKPATQRRCSTCGAKVPPGAKACRWQAAHDEHAKRKAERRKRKAAARKVRADGPPPRRRLKS